MNWKIDDTSLPAFLRLEVEGKPTREDYVSAWRTVIHHQQWKPGTAVLIDATKREPLGSEAPIIVDALADFFGKHNIDLGPSCVASITKEEQGYIFKRLLEYTAKLRGSNVTMRNFDDESAAVHWLTKFCDRRDRFQKTNH